MTRDCSNSLLDHDRYVLVHPRTVSDWEVMSGPRRGERRRRIPEVQDAPCEQLVCSRGQGVHITGRGDPAPSCHLGRHIGRRGPVP